VPQSAAASTARADLGLGEGKRVERAAWRGDAAAPRQLDLRGALQQLLAHAAPHLVRAVGDAEGARPLHGASPAPGLGKSEKGRKSPWPPLAVIIAPEG
jgi:hypothetical protein